MNRRDLQNLSRMRIQEARILLDNNAFAGAYYLAGYAVECALKACIAKQTRQSEFPDKATVNRSYTHNLQELIGVAGLSVDHQTSLKTNATFAVNWSIVKDWSEEARYDLTISAAQATQLYEATTARRHGVLVWVKKWW